MKRKKQLALGLIAVVVIGAAIIRLLRSDNFVPPPAARSDAPQEVLTTEAISIERGDTLAGLLARIPADQSTRTEILTAFERRFDSKKLRAGSQLTVTRRESGTLESLEYIIDRDNELLVANFDGVFLAGVVEPAGTIRRVSICGTIQDSLFESIIGSGGSVELAVAIAEIFAWDLDFHTDPREGDEFCALVERKEYLNGQPPYDRQVLAARYNNAGTVYDAHRFPDKDGAMRYFASDGQSLQAAFLRSPLKFDARISSRFSLRRLHPVLGVHRPHPGTDYAAPTGAPVQAIASGRVAFSGRSGGSGNLITIEHPGGYVSQYLHLSRRLVRRGERVQQGQRIGLVGATGLATGPHLDFRIRKDGRYLDFERLKFPRASRIGADRLDAFSAQRDRNLALMDAESLSPANNLASNSSPAATQQTP